MVKLHLSKHPMELDDERTPPAACGANDGVPVIRRGSGEGLVPLRAVSSEAHCNACVKVINRKSMGVEMTITPAYGRDYKSAKAAKADYDADKDFVINDISSPWDGSYVNKSQLSDHAGFLNIRYNKLTKVTRVA